MFSSLTLTNKIVAVRPCIAIRIVIDGQRVYYGLFPSTCDAVEHALDNGARRVSARAVAGARG